MKKYLVLAIALLGMFNCAYAGGPYREDERKVVIEGSTTVLPIAQAAAEDFMRQNQGVNIVVRGGGSGVGIASLIDQNCDIGDSSREIKDAELEKAVANGVSPKAHVVAMDGIAVIVNPSNAIAKISKSLVKDIFTGKVSDWSKAGGSGGQIVVLSRDSSSGTFEAFGALALAGEKVRPDALMQASNQAVASTVAKTPGAIGYVGLGYVTNEVKALDVDGVTPSKESVLLAKYPFSRPLFMYTNGAPTGTVRDFIDFVKSKEGQKIVDEQGFVALQ